jgi:hypothetical protein
MACRHGALMHCCHHSEASSCLSCDHDRLRAQLAAVTRERDEARAFQGALMESQERLAVEVRAVTAERDEARAALRGLLNAADDLPTCGTDGAIEAFRKARLAARRALGGG